MENAAELVITVVVFSILIGKWIADLLQDLRPAEASRQQ